MAQTKRKKGIFVTFEGTEGAGKSTLIHAVAHRLAESPLASRGTLLTREPGGSPIAERIRGVILEDAPDPLAELLLYEAARAEHVSKKIRPALDEGTIVLCDRFADSALAYQGHARGLPWAQVKLLNRIATRGLSPDLTVLMDIDPEVGLKRAREQTRFEAEGVEFQQRVRRGFLKARAENPRRWLVLKVEGKTPQQLAERVVRELLRRHG